MKPNLFTCFLLALTSLCIYAQNPDYTKLDSLLNSLEANNRFMGSLALSQNGKLLYTKAIGYAAMAPEKKPTVATKYRIGSITKMFTSALVFKAIENDKLKLDETIETYFPEIENADKITIGNLLNHRSGIFNFTSREDYKEWDTQAKTRDELVQIIAKGGSIFDPNSKAEYSNSNYVLLTFILEDTFGIPYSELVRRKIIEPIGLRNTYVGGKTDITKNEAYSFSYSEGWQKMSETDLSIPLGAGAIVSTPSDLTIFIDALFKGQLISQESLSTMRTISDNYGMGIFQVPFYDKIGFGHNGGIDGFTSVLAYFPEDYLAVALASNGTRYSNNDIIIAALSSYYGKPFEIPTFKTIPITSEDLDPYLGVYSSLQIPLKITITKDKNTLIGQATGQPSFPMEAVERDVFEFKPAGVRLEFDPVENSMTLKQGGGVFKYSKE
ncbi:serine hydrolase domain-containing protein [Pareuzebyella sediminis]|uniref:serine hydrolase domain-containing protein n=1 Tax=Pareuzebyella sediminis TaxID=2607998 RepID=UPI0011EC685F|nr:serine hydrolase domain-containing protein [Pareuzebyella sediminis]